MKTRLRSVLVVLVVTLAASSMFGQVKQTQQLRRPPAVAEVARDAVHTPKAGEDGSVYILDGMPMLFDLHHDTEVGTNTPVDVYVLVIEMQIMNSDGNLEPVGLQIHNFFTAKPQDRKNDFSPRTARDCKIWNNLILKAMKNRDPKSKTWPYIEFVTNANARVIQTNEDGQVWFSDDVECWGAMDRFSPF